MIGLQPFELTLLAAIILLGLEVATGTFVFLSFSVGLLAVAVVQSITGRFALGRDALLFGALAVLAIVVLRRTFGRHTDTKRSEGDVNDY